MPGRKAAGGMPRTAFCTAVLGALAIIATVEPSAVSAQPAHRTSRKSQPVPVTKTAPDITATIPAGTPPDAKPPALVTQDYGEALPKPFDLPAASRPRMRACGEKWQAIKMSGQAGSDTWREFAEKCLTARESAAKAASP